MFCSSCEREEKEVNSPTDTKVNEEGERDVSSTRAEILLQPVEKTRPMEEHSSRSSVGSCSHIGNPNHSWRMVRHGKNIARAVHEAGGKDPHWRNNWTISHCWGTHIGSEKCDKEGVTE